MRVQTVLGSNKRKVQCGLLTIERLGQEITQPVWWPLVCHRRTNAVEQSAWTASATGHHLRTVQMIVENVYVWLAGLWHLVSER